MAQPKVLIVHNYYQHPGGEDQVFQAEVDLLRLKGHSVVTFTAHNNEAASVNKLVLAANAVWNTQSYARLRKLLQVERPEVVHFHNTLSRLSPSVFRAAKEEGAAVVQTLHNYRLVCPGSLMYRNGNVCELCLTKQIPWPGVFHACYRKSFAASGTVAVMQTFHRLSSRWLTDVDIYVALTEFARRKFIRGGIPEGQIVTKPNFLLEEPPPNPGQGGYALFVGRLAPEKGIVTMLEAWKSLNGHIPLKIVGNGPLDHFVAAEVQQIGNVEWLGFQANEVVGNLMRGALALIFPSEWYEGLPMTIVEAYAAGLPVIAADLGSMSSLVRHMKTGLHYRPGDSDDLVKQVRWAIAHPRVLAQMGKHAREEYERKYTAEKNYAMLKEVYQKAMQISKKRNDAIKCDG